MELSYWQSRWNKGNIGFHMQEGYPGLNKHWAALDLSDDSNILVPLCGKSLDLIWLADRVKTVVGVEISEKAIHEFIEDNNLTAEQDSFATFSIYKSSNIDLWCGDFFKFPAQKYPPFNLIYDKAALVALPPSMRKRYAEKIISLSAENTQMLLHHFVYDQSEMTGPPFSVSNREIEELYGNDFDIQTLEENELKIESFQKFKMRGLQTHFTERLLLLTKR